MVECINKTNQKTEFIVDDFRPGYLRPETLNSLEGRWALALKELEDCCACPRHCHVNRLLDKAGYVKRDGMP